MNNATTDQPQSISNSQQEEERSAEEIIQTNHVPSTPNTYQIIIASGFILSITNYLELAIPNKKYYKNIWQTVSSGLLPWLILLGIICESAAIPVWIMSQKYNMVLGFAWKNLFQTIMMVPFIIYEKRNISKESYSYQEMIKCLKQGFIKSVIECIWLVMVLVCLKLTYTYHVLVLCQLCNFMMTWYHIPKNRITYVSLVLLLIGVGDLLLECFQDGISIHLIGDMLAILSSVFLFEMGLFVNNWERKYPPYLSIFSTSLASFIILITIGYYFFGLTLTLEEDYGVLSIIKPNNFANFFITSMILCFGMVCLYAGLVKLFDHPIIVETSMILQPTLSCLFIYLMGLQQLPSWMSIIGYECIMVGSILLQYARYSQLATQRVQQVQMCTPMISVY